MEPFLGEIKMFGGNFAPVNWALCDGRLLAISQYDALFALIGTTYGGDGVTTFGLPDLRGRVPVHRANNYQIGMKGGAEAVTLTADQLGGHTHATRCSSGDGTVPAPANDVWAGSSDWNAYSDQGANALMNRAAISSVGGGQPHDNMPPYLAVNFIIALEGIWPSRQ